jgi:hypothetical protein
MNDQCTERRQGTSWWAWGIGFVLVALGILVTALLFSPLRDEYFPRVYRFHLHTDVQLNETTAIDFSRRALEAARIDITGAVPMPFYPDKPAIFVANVVNTNSGVLMWKVPSMGTPRRTHFTVTVERAGSEIIVSLAENWL